MRASDGGIATLVKTGRDVHVNDADLAGFDVFDSFGDRGADIFTAIHTADADRT